MKYEQEAELLNRTEGGSRRRKSCIRIGAIVESEDPWWRDLLSPRVRERLEAWEVSSRNEQRRLDS